MWDVAIVGSGPAGASCAAFCAAAGLRTLVFERANFPREKVCGDCLNPTCWPVLERLDIADEVRAAPHGKLPRVEFIDSNGRSITSPLPSGKHAEIALRRSVLDQILLRRARRQAQKCGKVRRSFPSGTTSIGKSRRREQSVRADPRRRRWAQLDRRAFVPPDAEQRTRPGGPANARVASGRLRRSHRPAALARGLFRRRHPLAMACSTFAWSAVLTISLW